MRDSMERLDLIRRRIGEVDKTDEALVLSGLQNDYGIPAQTQQEICGHAVRLIDNIRKDDQPGLMEVFLSEYGLSTDEGVALMCMAEALLRIPDGQTIDALIEDKIAPSSWGAHLGQSSSSLVNASTWALMLTGKVLDTDNTQSIAATLHKSLKRLGEPVIRAAVKRAMKEMGKQFVLGETISDAIKRGETARKTGLTFSYDMLGEAAITQADANTYFDSYAAAIKRLSAEASSVDIRDNPGISVKLSALHPRYEVTQSRRVMAELTPRLFSLALQAKAANIGLNIDAEEADRLDLSLDIIQAVLSDPRLEGWDGFGVVVQAYNKRTSAIIDWLYALAENLDRKIMVRLVKGAYWDTEIKRAQVEGLPSYPVYTQKSATDVSYICCAKQLLMHADRLYPQFATHNAHSVAAILNMAPDPSIFEFQRLHGMGSVLHRQVMQAEGTRCRVYAPVGRHKDLLAYLVRRLLENGANSSFVNQIIDEDIAPEVIAENPFERLQIDMANIAHKLVLPKDIYAPQRQNSKGWDIHNYDDLAQIKAAKAPFLDKKWTVKPIIKGRVKGGQIDDIINPAKPDDKVGTVHYASQADVNTALKHAKAWQGTSAQERAIILNKAADLYQDNYGEIFTVLTREAGKTLKDAVSELREAVDFLRYYAAQAIWLDQHDKRQARGIITCISPWNFPLAIFTGQIAAALAAGNGCLAKPAEATPIIAKLAVQLLHRAGVPKEVLQVLPGAGSVIGTALSRAPQIKGICFTGSTQTAQIIHKNMAQNIDPNAPFIAETGGLNAMIVDSTALPEQAVTDIIASAFQSAGQRCSALRLLYVQADIAPAFLEMLIGAMEALTLGDPEDLQTDIGPIIDANARQNIAAYIDKAKSEGRLIKTLTPPGKGHFIAPALLSVSGIRQMEQEIFGPVLHIATFDAQQLPQIIKDINQSSYGLTFGLHTRIDNRVEYITQNIKAGNIYVNRNQIGAVVGTQPFGGEGLSGTGPKAGGPHYVKRLTAAQSRQALPSSVKQSAAKLTDDDTQESLLTYQAVQNILNQAYNKLTSNKLASDATSGAGAIALSIRDLPGPTGESNRLSQYARGTILCLGPSAKDAQNQADIALSKGCIAVMVAQTLPAITDTANSQSIIAIQGQLRFQDLTRLTQFDGVAYWGDNKDMQAIRYALAQRSGAILPLIGPDNMAEQCVIERHICIDTTASGGNVALLSGQM